MKKASLLATPLLAACFSCAQLDPAPSPANLVLRASVDPSTVPSTAFELGSQTLHFGEPVEFKASNVYPTSDSAGFPAVAVEFSEAESTRVSEWSQAHLDKQIGLFVDGELLTAPRLSTPIQDSLIIQGDFSSVELVELVRSLRGN